jgi:small subunit ribosomal protein S16
VAVKIRLKRLGKVRVPQYRIVVVDSRTKRDGRVIEEIGQYHPKEEPSLIAVASDRAQYWLGVGAQPSDAVHHLLRVTGDWQKFKGLPGAEGRLRVKESKRSKLDIFNEALQAAAKEPAADAMTKRASKKKAAPSGEKAAEGSEAVGDLASADAPEDKATSPKSADSGKDGSAATGVAADAGSGTDPEVEQSTA